MRVSKLFASTLREVPPEAETVSHRLMLRAGLIRKNASGIYSFLPLGFRTLKKIEGIIREEMDGIGAQEVSMPALLPAEIYRQSGRQQVSGCEMFRLKDGSGREYCLSFAHEEIFTETVKYGTRSYRSFPLCLYQIQTKFRDEARPRFGVVGGREFVEMDACSFDKDEKGLNESYEKIIKVYRRIFERCGLQYIVAESDGRAEGGGDMRQFIVRTETGETFIALCKACGYAANINKAVAVPQMPEENEVELPIEKVETPDCRTINDLKQFFACPSKRFAKTLIFEGDNRTLAAMVRGNRELNEAKLCNVAGLNELKLADPETVKKVTGAEMGFAGPVGLNTELYIDNEVAGSKNLITGANETGYHLMNVNMYRDFKGIVADLRSVVEGDCCPCCGKPISIEQGIEVGRAVKTGIKYSSAFGCVYLDGNGREAPVVMGSYGIMISRTLAAVIECNNDEYGIIWPVSVAPYHAVIVPVSNDPVPFYLAEEIYERLVKAGIEVLLDDRDERAGVKFNDADLMGIPVRITIGRRASERMVEFKLRNDKNKLEMNAEDAVNRTVAYIREKIS